MRDRRLVEFAESLAGQGVEITGGNDTVVLLNLRHLATKNGSISRGQAALYSALETLHALRVDVEEMDVAYILGNNMISHAIARGLESGIPALSKLLTSIAPEELFANLELASAFIFEDRHSNPAVQAQLNDAARRDLFAAGLLDSPTESHRDWMQVNEPAPPPLPREFQTNPLPWRSPFDTDEVY
jgi:hypothetical protein